MTCRCSDIFLGNYQRPEGRRWRKHSGVSCEVESWRRHERGKAFQQFQRFIGDMRRSVPPAVLEPVQQPAVGQKRKPFASQRRTAGISREPFQPQAVAGWNPHTCMDAVARNRRTALARWQSAIFHVDRIAHPRDAPAGPRARGYAVWSKNSADRAPGSAGSGSRVLCL